MRALLAAATAAAGARLAYAALRRRPPGGEKTWSRVNHRGEPVTLVEGPAVTTGAITGIFLSERIIAPGTSSLPLLIAGTGAAAFGTLDDLAGSSKRRGLRGHLGALLRGEVTTGAVKLLGIGATGLVAAHLLGGNGGDGAPGGGPPGGSGGGEPSPGGIGGTGSPSPGGVGGTGSPPESRGGLGGIVPPGIDTAINGFLIAGAANLVNLFDLRPGRAIKVACVSGVLLAVAGAGDGRSSDDPFGIMIVIAPVLGAAAAVLPEDLGERAMLGDCGANALGALLGGAAAATLPRPARAGLLAGITALTLASEKISFTKVIAATPPLNWLDMLGRRVSTADGEERHHIGRGNAVSPGGTTPRTPRGL